MQPDRTRVRAFASALALLAVGLAIGAALVPGWTQQRATAQSTNHMAIDADPGAAGVQTSRSVPSGSFEIAILAQNISAPYAGYQWQLEWDDNVLDPGGATENTGGTGLTICAPPSQYPFPPPGKEWWGNGAGCVGLSTTTFSGTLTTVTLLCAVPEGIARQTRLRLVSVTEEPDFGTTFLAEGGAPISTSLGADVTITCGTGQLETPTFTPTFTPTNTPTITNTPRPTNTPTPSATLQGTRSPTPTPTSTPAIGTPTAAGTATPTGTATSQVAGATSTPRIVATPVGRPGLPRSGAGPMSTEQSASNAHWIAFGLGALSIWVAAAGIAFVRTRR